MAHAEYNRLLGLARIAALYVAVAAMLSLPRPSVAGVVSGSLVIALGESLRVWAAGHLFKTRELITSGPYRHTRHPLYLGRLLIFSGLGMMTGRNAWWILPLGWIVFFAYYLPRKERVEPARLLEHHGEAYRRYHDAVPALFPLRRPFRGADRERRWSWARMARNREHWMLAGLIAVVAVMSWRAVAQ